MKTLSSGMVAQLNADVSTLATCVKIKRLDGVEHHFTSFDKDLVVNGVTYKATNSYNVTNLNITNRLSSDNFDISGMLDVNEVSQEDVVKGFYNDAEVWFFVVNYNDPNDEQDYISYGNLGQIVYTDNDFTVEFRSLSSKFTQKIVDLYSMQCRATLGDTKCGINLEPDAWVPGTAYSVGDEVSPITFNGYTFINTTAGTSSFATSDIDFATNFTADTDNAGLADATTYYTTINSVDYSITGASTDTVAGVITKLNTALTGVATVSYNSGDILITKDTAGTINTQEYATNTSDVFYVMNGNASVTLTNNTNEPTWNTSGTTNDGSAAWTYQVAYTKLYSTFLVELPITNFRITFTAFSDTNLNLSDIALFDRDGNIVTGLGTYTATKTVQGSTTSVDAELWAYDGDATSAINAAHSGQNIIIDYAFEDITSIYKYTVLNSLNGADYATAWTFSVSPDNGQNYYDVDTRSGISSQIFADTRVYYELQNKSNMSLTGIDTASRSEFYIDPATDPHVDDWYKYGKVEWLTGSNQGVINDITSYDSTTGLISLFLTTPYNINFNDSLKLTVGCNRLLLGTDGTTSTGHCKTKFNNVINFRGEPYIPSEDFLLERSR